jgi:outer membrane protein assembly factor BamD (BamD/ComL family)
MRGGHCLLICACVGILAASAVAQTTRTWELRNGNWAEVLATATTGPATQPVEEPDLDRAEQLLSQGDFRPARTMLVQWIKTHKEHAAPLRDRCLFLLGDAFFQSDDRLKAFYYYDELMDEYPESPLFQKALQKQYDIADGFLNGYKRVFLWFRILDTSDEAVEMMYRIRQRAPGSPLAERALLRTADYYFNDRDYDLAGDVYKIYIDDYPQSPQVPRVKLRRAFASLAQFRGVNFEATNIIDARLQLVAIQNEYPEMAAENNVETVIEQIDSAFAKKLIETAQYYERVHEWHGAVYEYRFLARVYPSSPEAFLARDRLARMPVKWLDDPPPVPAGGYWPSTQPTASAADAR